MSEPSKAHLVAAKRILRYIKGMKELQSSIQDRERLKAYRVYRQ